MTRLTRLRHILGLTQEQAAQRFGVNVRTYRRWEQTGEITVRRSSLLLPGIKVQGWLLEGELEAGHRLVTDLLPLVGFSLLAVQVLAEPGRLVRVANGDDSEHDLEIATVERDGITTTTGERVLWACCLSISKAG